MDSLGLQILIRELEEDGRVFAEATALARERVGQDHPGSLEACAYELNRSYNILEKCFERVCTAFENHFEKRGDYHERLIERLSLDLPGIRPAFLPPSFRGTVRDLKGFPGTFSATLTTCGSGGTGLKTWSGKRKPSGRHTPAGWRSFKPRPCVGWNEQWVAFASVDCGPAKGGHRNRKRDACPLEPGFWFRVSSFEFQVCSLQLPVCTLSFAL